MAQMAFVIADARVYIDPSLRLGDSEIPRASSAGINSTGGQQME
jgi:hypothetical protein